MPTDYSKILTFSLRHDYYRDGRCRGLSARPSADTETRLRKFDAHWRGGPSGFFIVGPATAKTDMANLRLRFFLQAVNPRLFYFTGTSDNDEDLSARGYHFGNSRGSGELTAQAFAKVATSVFPFGFQAGQKTVELQVTQLGTNSKQLASVEVLAHDEANGQFVFSTKLDLTDRAPGLFQLEHSNASNGATKRTIIYVDNEASRVRSLFGIVELDFASLPEPTPHWDVVLQLRSRAAKWVYTVVAARSGIIPQTLKDHSQEVGDVVRQDHIDDLVFESRTDGDVLHFESTQPVRFSEQPRKNLILTYDEGSPQHRHQRILPNPEVDTLKKKGGHLIAETMIHL